MTEQSRSAAQDLEDEKRELRARMRARRGAVSPEEAAQAGAQLAALAAALLDERPAACALLYAPLAGEVDTGPLDRLLRARGTRVAYPRVDPAADRALALHLAAPDQLAPSGRFALGLPTSGSEPRAAGSGLREPSPDAPALDPDALDWIVVPGLAFDAAGGRLGFGRGYYDALLARAPRALRVGAAFAWQLEPRVPVAPHDQRLDFVLADRAHATGARPIALPKELPR